MNDALFTCNKPREEGYYWALIGKAWTIVRLSYNDKAGIVTLTEDDQYYFLDRNDLDIKRWSKRLLPPVPESYLLPLKHIEYTNTSIEHKTKKELLDL